MAHDYYVTLTVSALVLRSEIDDILREGASIDVLCKKAIVASEIITDFSYEKGACCEGE